MSRKSFRATRPGGAGDWVTEMMHAIVSDSALEELGVSVEEAGKAVCKNIFPVVKKHIAFIVESNNPNFEAALVDEITQGEGPISSLELLEKVKEATQRIKELVRLSHWHRKWHDTISALISAGAPTYHHCPF